MSFKNFQVIITVKNSFNYHAQTSESDLERLNCLSQWATAHFSLTGIMSQLIEPFAIFCITHFLHRKLPQQPDSAGIGCLPQEAPGTSRHVCCLLSTEPANTQLQTEGAWLGAVVTSRQPRRTEHWSSSSFGNYLSFCKATEQPGTVIVDAESRDGPVLGSNRGAAQTQPESLVLIWSRTIGKKGRAIVKINIMQLFTRTIHLGYSFLLKRGLQDESSC